MNIYFLKVLYTSTTRQVFYTYLGYPFGPRVPRKVLENIEKILPAAHYFSSKIF